MTSAVTQFSLLDPALFAKQFNAVYAGAVTQFGILDPTLMEKQMNAASSTTTFRPTPLAKGLTDPGWSIPVLGADLGV